jgi:hypothetical protein
MHAPCSLSTAFVTAAESLPLLVRGAPDAMAGARYQQQTG